jgi:hypothetical protein
MVFAKVYPINNFNLHLMQIVLQRSDIYEKVFAGVPKACLTYQSAASLLLN